MSARIFMLKEIHDGTLLLKSILRQLAATEACAMSFLVP